jgi:TetR/AcrR family transcriptional regulator, tetracycline repressor protein
LLIRFRQISYSAYNNLTRKIPARARAAASGRTKSAARASDTKLSKERILSAALDLIDQKGLEQFSLRDVARSLRVYPRAIYWYVASRNELLSEVAAYALRNVYPPASSSDWKDWLAKLLRQYRTALRRHPNIAPLIGASLLSGGAIHPDTIERILTMLGAAGFRDEHLVDAYNVVIAAQVGFVTLELAALPSEDRAAWVDERKKRISTIDVLRHPMLGRHLPALANRAFILRWSNGTEVPLDSSFDEFVEVVIQGLAQRLAASR